MLGTLHYLLDLLGKFPVPDDHYEVIYEDDRKHLQKETSRTSGQVEAIPPVEERMKPEQQEDDGLRMRFSDNESKDTLVM